MPDAFWYVVGLLAWLLLSIAAVTAFAIVTHRLRDLECVDQSKDSR